MSSDQSQQTDPLHVFNFLIEFGKDSLEDSSGSTGSISLCQGAFSECSGLEATMEPKVIKEGGRNYGDAQRAGKVTFGTVILKRGIVSSQDLWQWFEVLTAKSGYSYRLQATITLLDQKKNKQLEFKLQRAMPVKFKAPDLSAVSTEVGVEELHIVHEGLEVSKAT